jgi:hypothetical protein
MAVLNLPWRKGAARAVDQARLHAELQVELTAGMQAAAAVTQPIWSAASAPPDGPTLRLPAQPGIDPASGTAQQPAPPRHRHRHQKARPLVRCGRLIADLAYVLTHEAGAALSAVTVLICPVAAWPCAQVAVGYAHRGLPREAVAFTGMALIVVLLLIERLYNVALAVTDHRRRRRRTHDHTAGARAAAQPSAREPVRKQAQPPGWAAGQAAVTQPVRTHLYGAAGVPAR